MLPVFRNRFESGERPEDHGLSAAIEIIDYGKNSLKADRG